MVYREQIYRCLACATALEHVGLRLACPSCLSAMVTVPALQQMLRKMSPAGVSVPIEVESHLHTRNGERRGCPCCGDPMLTYRFVELPVDLCEKHGVWFDREELELALRNAEALRAAREHDDGEEADELEIRGGFAAFLAGWFN